MVAANEQNKVTLNAIEPFSTLNFESSKWWYHADIAHGKPIPRNTLTAFEPLTLPIELSAYLSCSAATFDANVSR